MSGFFRRQSQLIALVECLLLLFGISWVDLSTGHQVSLVLFYTGPIVLAVWLCDSKGAFLIAGLAGVLWLWADLVSNHYPDPALQAWEIPLRFAFFFCVALAGVATKEKQREAASRISLLEHTRKLEQEIIEVSEHEQQRIGRDLHDGLCQYLAGIGCAVKSLKVDLEGRGLTEFAAAAADLEKLLEESVKHARILAHGLVPVQLDEAGLPAALQELAASTTRLFGVECTFEFAGEDKFHHPGKSAHLYRIAQEAINNATKHAHPQNVKVRLSANSSAMSLSVADNGTGFSKNEKDRSGVGISIMRYRANEVGGELEIEDRPNGGTIVSCTVPIQPQI